jgi:CspA family cold shock protein
MGGIAMKTGTVKWFNKRKGYGFIKPIDGGFEVYVQFDAVERAGLADLQAGQKIDFETVVDQRTGEIFAVALKPFADGLGSTQRIQVDLGGSPSVFSVARLWARKIAPHLSRS